MATPTVRKGQHDVKLSREEFERRLRERFYDPAFASEGDAIERVVEVAWHSYDEYRESPRTRKAGPEFADPDFNLPIEWLESRERILQAQRERMIEGDRRTGRIECGDCETGRDGVGGLQQAGRNRAEGRGQDRDQRDRQPAKLGHGITPDQVVDRGGVDIDAGDHAAAEILRQRFALQHTARHPRALQPGREPLRREPAILGILNGSEQHHLAVEPASEIVAVVVHGALAKVGKRKSRDVIRAALEIERHRIRNGAWDPVARKRGRPVRRKFRLGVLRSRRQFERHRGRAAAIHGECQR